MYSYRTKGLLEFDASECSFSLRNQGARDRRRTPGDSRTAWRRSAGTSRGMKLHCVRRQRLVQSSHFPAARSGSLSWVRRQFHLDPVECEGGLPHLAPSRCAGQPDTSAGDCRAVGVRPRRTEHSGPPHAKDTSSLVRGFVAPRRRLTHVASAGGVSTGGA